MKKFNFVLLSGALLLLGAYKLESAETAQAEKAAPAAVVSEEIAAKKQTKDQAALPVEKAEATPAVTNAETAGPVTSEKKCDCPSAKKATPAVRTPAPKK